MMKTCHLCHSTNCQLIAEITKRPAREIAYGTEPDKYRRQVYKCNNCSVYFNIENHIEDDFYQGKYNQAVYKNGFFEKYSEIMSLPEERSDNKQRVSRIADFCKNAGWDRERVRVLDVGSGLSVFAGRMGQLGFECYCVDPDPRAIEHAINNVKVAGAHVGTLADLNLNLKFDIISFNKVLEHIKNPLPVLVQAKTFLTQRGVIYIELPDGKGALSSGSVSDREEFDLGHYTIFDRASLEFLIDKARCESLEIKEIHEPSDKYTIYAFVTPPAVVA